MAVEASAAAGWYEDPSGRYRERWWDGVRWTGHVRGEFVWSSGPAAPAAARSERDVDTMEIRAVVVPREPTPAGEGRPSFWSRWSVAVFACVFGGAFVVVVGSMLTWVTASSGGFSTSRSGIDGDGVFTLTLALVVALAFTLVRSRRAAAITVLSIGAMIALIVAYDLIDISNKVGDVPARLDISVKPGIGLIFTGIAAIAITVSGALAMNETDGRVDPAGAKEATDLQAANR
jgi:Protein of unknown function (DUF2510)